MNHCQQVAFIAPARLRGAFKVLLQSMPTVTLLAEAPSWEVLREVVGVNEPDAVLVYVAEFTQQIGKGRISSEQISQIKSHWPQTQCVAIVDNPGRKEQIEKYGADQVFIEGLPPIQLVRSIEGSYR